MSKMGLSYRTFLTDELKRRQSNNPRYSMRAFARDLEIPSSRLSEIMTGKSGLSEERAADLAKKINLSKKNMALFLDLVRRDHSRSHVVKKIAEQRVKHKGIDEAPFSEDQFNLIADWHHLALMEVLNLKNVKHTVEDFAAKLGLTKDLASESIERLLRLKLLSWKGDSLIPETESSTTTDNVPSSAIRKYFSQMLGKANSALESHSVEKRDFSAVVCALNSQQMEVAKERIAQFRRTLMDELSEMDNKDAVYCLAIQFFELTEN